MNLRIIKGGYLRDPLVAPFELCISRDDAEHLISTLQTALVDGHQFGWVKIEPTPEPTSADPKSLFISEIEAVCRKHGLMITAESQFDDNRPLFLISGFDDSEFAAAWKHYAPKGSEGGR